MGLEDIVNNNRQRRYVVTGAQYNAVPYEPFLQSLERYCSQTKAELLIVPCPGVSVDEANIHESLQRHTVISKDYSLHRHLQIRQFNISSHQINPLTGLRRFIQYNKSAIVSSPKQFMEIAPTGNKGLPKVIMSTGVVTMPHYRDSRLGHVAHNDHTYGAIVVETNNDTFHYRAIRSKRNGEFTDMGVTYSAKTQNKAITKALVLGDIHIGQTDKPALNASNAFIQRFKPEAVVIHDLFDGYSISHHHVDKIIRKSKMWTERVKGPSLATELQECREYLDTLLKLGSHHIYVVKSNHDEHLNRYLEEGRFGSDHQNLYVSSKIAAAYIEGKDPLEYAMNLIKPLPASRVTFLARDDDLQIKGYQLANHGDLGPNGSKASMANVEYSSGKSIVGHAHSPSILREVYRVGTLTSLQLDYNRGPSSWLNTNAVIWGDGSVQLINIINGKYKAD